MTLSINQSFSQKIHTTAILVLVLLISKDLQASNKDKCSGAFQDWSWTREISSALRLPAPTIIQTLESRGVHTREIYTPQTLELREMIANHVKHGKVLTSNKITQDFIGHDTSIVYAGLKHFSSTAREKFREASTRRTPFTQEMYESLLTPLTLAAILCKKLGISFRVENYDEFPLFYNFRVPVLIVESEGAHNLNRLANALTLAGSTTLPLKITYTPAFDFLRQEGIFAISAKSNHSMQYFKSSFFRHPSLSEPVFAHEFTHWLISVAVLRGDIEPIWNALAIGALPISQQEHRSKTNKIDSRQRSMSELITMRVSLELQIKAMREGEEKTFEKAKLTARESLVLLDQIKKIARQVTKAADSDLNLQYHEKKKVLSIASSGSGLSELYIFKIPVPDIYKDSMKSPKSQQDFVRRQLHILMASANHLDGYYGVLDMAFNAENASLVTRTLADFKEVYQAAAKAAKLPISPDIFITD